MVIASKNTIKLQAFMAQQGIASRRKSEELIQEGKVVVNGQKAHLGQRIDPIKDAVTFEGKEITKKSEEFYFLVNKPKGLISTTSDELGRDTVLSLLPKINARLYPVGRLDKDSEGLMLLTTDGTLTDLLTHPRYQVPKTYEVLVAGTPTYKAVDHLRRGVKLKEGYTQPADVTISEKNEDSTWLSITIKEGRYRQVRRMLERVGYDTLKLVRVQLGPFYLEDLQGSRTKKLNAMDIQKIIEELKK